MTQQVDKDKLPLNQPRRTPSHPTKSHIVKTKVDGKEKIIRFGQQGASTAGKPKAGESDRMKAKRASFKARHGKNIAKGKSSAAYWADKVKWADGGSVSLEQLADKYLPPEVMERMEVLGRQPSAVERAVYDQLGMEPGVGNRPGAIPIREDGEWIMPRWMYEAGKGFVSSGVAMKGQQVSPEDVLNTALTFTGGSFGASHAAGPAAEAGTQMLGMAVKNKGGNWLDKSVAEAIAPLQVPDPANRLREMEAFVLRGQASAPGVVDDAYMQLMREQTMPDIAINNWLETKLNSYIRNDMGTPEDPVRALAERGTLHFEPPVQFPPYTQREMEGFPNVGLGQSELAKRWEAATDLSIRPFQAGDLINPEKYNSDSTDGRLVDYPWLSKVPPETKVYDLKADNNMGTLGFNHLVDELRNATRPDTDLPERLRIDYNKLDRMTVPQIVEKVADINAWRAQEAVRAEREGMMANLQGAPRVEDPELNLSFVESPGGKWVDIPETVDETNLNLCTSIGKAGGWCTQGEGLAKSYGSGDNRLTALVDAEGRPHAQAKISTVRVNAENTQMGGMLTEQEAIDDQLLMNAATVLQERGLGDLFGEQVEVDVLAEALGFNNNRGLSREARDALNEVYAEAERRLPKTELSVPDITELKPPGNTFNSARAQEYARRDPQYKQKVTDSVLRFLNGGNWGKVADLDQYGVVDLKDSNAVMRYLNDIYNGSDNGVMIFNYAIDSAPPDTPRFMSRGQFVNFLEPYEPMPPEGFAKGGTVRAYDPLQIENIMSSINSPRNYAEGGSVLAYNPGRVDAILNQFRGAE
ncbi:MAG: hypothetical protein ITD33_02460 [Nitrosarchaeum sp.]|nr:hypothetical protein [Nitrosarchaeum sp.]